MTEPLPEAADAEHLTAVLRRAGVLMDGRVRAVEVLSARPTILSRIIRLRLDYDGAPGNAPPSLILKTVHPERRGAGWNAGRREVAFYNQVAGATPRRVVPHCFEGHWKEEAGEPTWHLLLEDLTDTHAAPTAWPVPPTTAQRERILRAWAQFHAAWWDNPRLGSSVGAWTDGDGMNGHLQRFAEEFKRFTDRLGDRLSRERRELYERLLAAGLRLHERHLSHRHLTIVHGDAHFWNCFVPKDDGGGDVLLFDWDSWRIDTATDDLAYMMARHWYPNLRQRAEQAALDHYHAELVANGVRGYDRAALADDYRLSVLWHIQIPVWQASINIPPVIWWNNLERIFLAVDDLGCRDLLV
jgi:thiamine kinase-like enzyme